MTQMMKIPKLNTVEEIDLHYKEILAGLSNPQHRLFAAVQFQHGIAPVALRMLESEWKFCKDGREFRFFNIHGGIFSLLTHEIDASVALAGIDIDAYCNALMQLVNVTDQDGAGKYLIQLRQRLRYLNILSEVKEEVEDV